MYWNASVYNVVYCRTASLVAGATEARQVEGTYQEEKQGKNPRHVQEKYESLFLKQDVTCFFFSNWE